MAVGLASVCAGCARAPHRHESAGGAPSGEAAPIEITAPDAVETLDPRFVVDYLSMRTSRLVHAGLVRLDPATLEPRPYVAKAWRWEGDRTLHVDLRDDVRFHSGAPLTSKDVVATLAAFQSPEVGSRHLRIVEAIASVDEDGPHAVTIHLSRAHATLLTDLELPILRADQAFGPPDPDGAMDGLGPYVVASATRGDLRLAPARFGALPTPAHPVIVRTVHDDNARALRLLTGRSDVALNVLSLVPALDGKEGLSVATRPGASLTYMIARQDRGPFADVRVRRALAMGIDRQGLAATLFAGHAHVAATLIPKGHWAHTDLPPPPYDPEAARALVNARGEGPIHVTLLTSTDRFRGTVARAVAQELEAAGFAIDVVPIELGTMLARLNAGDFELALLMFPELTEPNVLRNLLHSSFVPPVGYNRARLHDPELDALLDAGDQNADLTARRAIYAAVEQRVRDLALLFPLWNEDQLVLVSVRARGFLPSAEGRWLAIASLP